MPTKFLDFDAARAERADEPLIIVTVGGQKIAIARPSAQAVFDWFRVGRDLDMLAALPSAQQTKLTMELFESLFGASLGQLEAAGATNAEINELAGQVCALAMAEGSGPNRKTRRARAQKRRSRSTSSSDGRSSRRTTSASTGSTSASI